MKAKEFAVIEKKLLPYLPGFVMKGKLLFIPPVDDFLRGVYFENSSGRVDFYVEVLYMLLFPPQEGIHFLHGYRLNVNNHGLLHADDPNLLENLLKAIKDRALPFLDSVSTLRGVLELVRSRVESRWPRGNSHHVEELAYLLIKNGEYSAALQWLANLREMLAGHTIPSLVEQRNRAQLMEEKLLQSPAAALAQLEEWKAETVANLGLEKYFVSAQKTAD